MQALKENIMELLLKGQHLTQEQLDKAMQIHRDRQLPLRRVLVEQGFISEEALLSLLSNQLFIPTIHLTKYKFDPEIVKLIPEHIAKQYSLIPLSRLGKTLTIAISDPLNVFALDDVKTLTGFNIDTVLSPHEEIIKSIETQYGGPTANMQQILDEDSAQGASSLQKDVELLENEQIELSSAVSESEKPLIVKLVDLILTEALKRRASDIHIEPMGRCMRCSNSRNRNKMPLSPASRSFPTWILPKTGCPRTAGSRCVLKARKWIFACRVYR
jgi:type IV pilus assembly protein PilB